MKHLVLSAIALSFFVVVSYATINTTAARADSAAPAAAGTPSLYKRLGGYDGLAAVTDDFIGRLVRDPQLSKFFVGLSDDSKARVRQLFLDELCAASGGPCLYIGRDMKTAHKGLNINEAEWNAAGADLTATFDKFGVKQRERDDLGAILAKVKPDIVTAK
ncbi:MAG TPA: group 1 truncated hemoglobin [Candidatus Eremiobacteraceae bacterium]|nr:group 1 truncated hemoglobin [Candidatus Eremiobacteraceae bacterium]